MKRPRGQDPVVAQKKTSVVVDYGRSYKKYRLLITLIYVRIVEHVYTFLTFFFLLHFLAWYSYVVFLYIYFISFDMV